METLDNKDFKILALLFRDSRLPLRAMGREVDLGVSAVKSRIRNLVTSGGVEGFVTLVNPAAFGFSKRCVFCCGDHNMNEEAMGHFRPHGKPIEEAELLGGLSLLTMVTKRRGEAKVMEPGNASRLFWVEDLSPGWRASRRLKTTDLLIIKYLSSNPRAGIGEIARYASVSAKTASQRLETLRKEGALRFGIQINPLILGVAQASIIIRLRERASAKILDRVDETLSGRFLCVRYPRVDAAAIRCYVCAKNVFEIENARRTISSFDEVESTEEYLFCRTRRFKDWLMEEIDARLGARDWLDDGRDSVDQRPPYGSPVSSLASS